MKSFFSLLLSALLAVPAFAGGYQDVSISDLKSDIAAGKVTILDANGTASWQRAHIPGAIDFEKNASTLAPLLPKDKGALIVAYCGGPMCKAYVSAAQAAEKLGYTNIKHLSAGISGWQAANEAVEKGN